MEEADKDMQPPPGGLNNSTITQDNSSSMVPNSKPRLSPAEQIAIGLAPVKPEYLVQRTAPRKTLAAVAGVAATASATAGQQELQAKSKRQIRKVRGGGVQGAGLQGVGFQGAYV